MLKDFRSISYDVFGYIIPGLVALVGSTIAFWSIFTPDQPITMWSPSVAQWVSIAIGAYLFGHVTQAIGSLLVRWDPSVALLEGGGKRKGSMPPELLDAIRKRLKHKVNIARTDLPSSWIYYTCDAIVRQYGNPGDRTVYRSLEGLNRGMAVASVLLSAALIARAISGETILHANGSEYRVSAAPTITAALIAAFAAVAAFFRYRRFAELRVRYSMLSFLAIALPEREDSASMRKHPSVLDTSKE